MTDITPTGEQPHIIGYLCLRYPEGGVIPVSAYMDPCPDDVPVWSDGTSGERQSGSYVGDSDE